MMQGYLLIDLELRVDTTTNVGKNDGTYSVS